MPDQKPKTSKPEKDSLDAVAQSLGEMESRVEDWGDLSSTLTQRIEEEARLRASVQEADPNFMRDTEDQMKPIDYGFGLEPPMPDREISELGESDIFRPVPTASEPGTLTSGREIQVIADKKFQWSPEFMDRVETDVMDYYLDGESNA